MKKFFMSSALVAGMFASQGAFAGCWMECIARNPFTGKCIAKTKLCNIEDASKSIEYLGKDVGAAYENMKNEWVSLYHRLPANLQYVLDKYPITFATLILPGTREYTLAVLAIEEYAGRAKARARQVAEVIQGAPDWKVDLTHDGEAFILMLEGMDLGNIDYTSPNPGLVPDKYTAVFDSFLGCIKAANDLSAGNECLKKLKRDASSIL